MRADRRNCHNLMPRKKRIWYKGACFHVMGRGVRRGSIFREEEDYRLFMFLLEQMRSKYPFTLHAFCLMTNHFHLQITTGSDPIWMIMQLPRRPEHGLVMQMQISDSIQTHSFFLSV